MGIKDLWHILGPFCERKPLFELQGKTVAIDLSCWVCEAQNIAEYQVQPRMYLRNLYFRTCYLLLMDVHPVFVLDGKAPELKYKTIAARNAVQFRGAKPRNNDSKLKKGKDRSRFNHTLKRCEEMLKLMGLACVKGNGEAEALCAHLNEDNLVSGCITQDSDCFAYGAKVVYRNFSISQQGVHASSGGSVDVYDINKLINSNGFGRNKIISLALLCGSDYNEGVFGVGKDSVIKLFDEISDDEILDRLRTWRSKQHYYSYLEKKISDKSVCTKCGHSGRQQSHTKSGCKDCGMNKSCRESDYKEQLQIMKTEVNIRKKALEDTDFPDEELIAEFLTRKDEVRELNLKWQKPNMIKFVHFCREYLEWDEIYSFQKFIPILSRWQILNAEPNYSKETKEGLLTPDYIKKARNPKGIPSYEIIWTDKDNYFKDLIPEEQLIDIDPLKLFSTIEPQTLVDKAYPDLVSKFKESKIKPKKSVKRVKKTEEQKTKKVRKTKPKNTEQNQDSIDTYLKKAIINNVKEYKTPQKRKEGKDICDFDSDRSNFGDESDMDLSDIVESIVSKKPDYVKEHLNKIKTVDNLNSSFFAFDGSEEDVFEKTFNKMCRNDSEESINEENGKCVEDDCKRDSDEDDSFIVNYVPLAERIKLKAKS